MNGWDDPRMPTVVGMRRRGFTPEGLRDFCKRVGVTKVDGSIVDVAMLEYCIRQSLENTAARGMAVLNPLKVTLTNLPEAMDLSSCTSSKRRHGRPYHSIDSRHLH